MREHNTSFFPSYDSDPAEIKQLKEECARLMQESFDLVDEMLAITERILRRDDDLSQGDCESNPPAEEFEL